MSNIFYKIGYFSSAYPCVAVIFCITLTSLLGLGMYNVRLETDPQNLWVSPASRTYEEQQNFSDNFGQFYRTDQMMLLSREDQNKNIFQHEGLSVIYFIQQIIGNMKIESKGKYITLDELCFKPVSGKGCLAPSPMDIWLQDTQLMLKDDDLQFTTLCTESVDINRTNIPCSDTNGIPVIREAIFAGITCQPREHDTQPCDHCYIQAKSLVVTYLLNHNQFTEQDALLWEKEVYEETIQRLNKLSNNPKDENYLWLVEQYNKSPTVNKPVPLDPEILSKYKAVYLAERSISDELVTETTQNVWVVILSYLMMFIYISIALGQFPSTIYSCFLLGLGGIFIVAASMIGSLGIVSYMNIGLTMISGEVIPFLILAIGVDNMFIITHTLERTTNAKSLPEQMGKTLQSVGPSITTAAICETLAFLVGALTKMPALQTFCVQAAFGVFLDYIFQITVFVAFLTWDQQRKNEKKLDCLFCIERPQAPDGRNPQYVRKFISKFYYPFLEKTSVRIGAGIIFVGLFVISVLGCIFLENGLEEQVSMVSDSDLFNYFTFEKRLIEIGPPAYLILKGFDYNDEKDLQTVATLSNSLAQLNETVQPPIYSWVASFNLFRKNDAEWTVYCGTKDILLDDFPSQLKRFINTKITSSCCQRYGICGETFQADIVLDDEGYVKTSRLRFQHRPIHTSAEYILTFEQTRQVIDKLSDQFQEGRSAFAYSLPYIFYDQYSYIRAVAIQNILLALATIFLTVTIVQDVLVAGIVVATVFIITFNLIGLVWLMNVLFGGFQIQINAISVVNLVTCIGLAVEFCAHTVIKFRNLSGTREVRAKEAMLTMGTSVFIGIASTKFIGVIVLAFASSTLFRLYYFRMYFLMIITGTFNGLCLLPILLSLIGPASTSSSHIHSKVENESDNLSQSENDSFKNMKKYVNK